MRDQEKSADQVKAEKKLLAFIIMLAVGSAVFVGVGDYLINNNGYPYPEPTLTGWEYWILGRIHLFGLFFASMGIIGLIAWCCEHNLISDHKTK